MTKHSLEIRQPLQARMNAQGRIVIPAEVRNRLGWSAGEERSLRVDEATGEVRLATPRAYLEQVRQRMSAHHWKEGDPYPSDALIAERRFEAALEQVDDLDERRRLRREHRP